MNTASVFDCTNGQHAPVCTGCDCECHDTVKWGIPPGSSFAVKNILLDGAEIPFEEAVLAAMYVIRHAYSVADAELLHEVLGLGESEQPCVFSTETGEFVPVPLLDGAA